MTFKEFLRFFYGLTMGTSTPFLKPTQRFLFPRSKFEIDSGLHLLLGGSGICAVAKAPGQRVVINTGQGEAARELREWADQLTGAVATTVILNSATADFSGGVSQWSDASSVLLAGDISPGLGPQFEGVLIDHVREERVVELGEETLHLIPIAPAATGSDLAVFFEKRSILFTGPLFFNRIHPTLRKGSGLDATAWIRALEDLLARFQPRTVVPAEGDLARVDDVQLFISYLKDLTNPVVEFSHCRQSYDWMEIPSATSLEENFDLMRSKSRTHVTLEG